LPVAKIDKVPIFNGICRIFNRSSFGNGVLRRMVAKHTEGRPDANYDQSPADSRTGFSVYAAAIGLCER
jgi:hypothetical protein